MMSVFGDAGGGIVLFRFNPFRYQLRKRMKIFIQKFRWKESKSEQLSVEGNEIVKFVFRLKTWSHIPRPSMHSGSLSTKREVTYIDIYGTSAMYGSKRDHISPQNRKFAHKYVHTW